MRIVKYLMTFWMLNLPTILPQLVSYKGFKVLRVLSPPNQTESIKSFLEKEGGRIWIKRKIVPNNTWAIDVLCSRDKCPVLKSGLHSQMATFKEVIKDVQKLIDSEDNVESSSNKSTHQLTWTSYHSYDDIISYCNYLAKQYPDLCTVQTIGTSVEQREIKLLAVSKNGKRKPGIWIDAGFHAREWIGPATATYFMNQLLENSENANYIDMLNWYILPVANPDGYEYSRNKDRLWRKNRNKYRRCVGVDLNRNFDFQWEKNLYCREDTSGPQPFSEPESQAIRDFLLANNNIGIYVSLHSYSQLWLIPWGFTRQKPLDYDELLRPAKAGTEAIKNSRGTLYQVGTPPDLIYPVNGASDDWAKGVAGIKFSYTLELPDTGEYGFLLPASDIIPVGIETWNGIKSMSAELVTRIV